MFQSLIFVLNVCTELVLGCFFFLSFFLTELVLLYLIGSHSQSHALAATQVSATQFLIGYEPSALERWQQNLKLLQLYH